MWEILLWKAAAERRTEYDSLSLQSAGPNEIHLAVVSTLLIAPHTTLTAGSLESRLCVLHSQADYAQTMCIPARNIAWAGRNTQSITWSTFALIGFKCCLWHAGALDACVTWQTTINRTHRTYTWLTHTESFAEWQKTGTGCTSCAFKLPGHDVTRTWRLAINLTDYTYDSELDSVPLAFRRSSSSRRGTYYSIFVFWKLHSNPLGSKMFKGYDALFICVLCMRPWQH